MSGYEAYLWKPWINHSKDVVTGLTITVPASTGVLVVAALAVLVNLAGAATWTIASYVVYQVRARKGNGDIIHRIQQVLLRNSGSPAGSAWEIFKSGHGWSDEVTRPKRRAYALAIWPMIINIGFIAASIFVARVTVAAHKANVILLQPTNCGLEGSALGRLPGEIKGTDPQWTGKHMNDTRRSRAYVDRCYDASNGSLGCTQLPTQRLPFTSRSDADCPFDEMCTLGRDAALQLDTGELDSHAHLGINAKPSDRIHMRMTATCSVLKISDYLNVTTDPGTHFGTTRSVEIKLGPFGPVDNPVINYTSYYNTVMTIQALSYQIQSFLHYPGNTTEGLGWTPIPQLDVANGDTTLIIIFPNNVMYRAPSFDPLFSANGTWTFADTENITWIQPDYAISAMACVDQLQICNPAKAICSPLLGAMQLMLTNLFALDLNEAQIVTAWRIIFARMNSHISDAVDLGPSALAVAEMLNGNMFSPGLPDDQWIRESTRWFQTNLANMQHRIVDYPNNDWSRNLSDQWQSTGIQFGVMPVEALTEEPAGRIEALKHQCGSQMVRSTNEYQSFVVVGIIIVVVVSGALIFTSWTLHYCVSWRKSRRPGGKKRYKLEAYDADSNISLARASMATGLHSGELIGGARVDVKGAQAVVEERGALLSPRPSPPRYTSSST